MTRVENENKRKTSCCPTEVGAKDSIGTTACDIEDALMSVAIFRELDYCEANDIRMEREVVASCRRRVACFHVFCLGCAETRSEIALADRISDRASRARNNRDRPRIFHRQLRQIRHQITPHHRFDFNRGWKSSRIRNVHKRGREGFVPTNGVYHHSNVGCVCTYNVCILIGSQSSRRHR